MDAYNLGRMYQLTLRTGLTFDQIRTIEKGENVMGRMKEIGMIMAEEYIKEHPSLTEEEAFELIVEGILPDQQKWFDIAFAKFEKDMH